MKVKFTKNGITQTVKVGFSWTVFFFGWVALLIRKQYVYAAVGFFTFNLASFGIMFFANKAKAHDLIEQGWEIEKSVPQWGIVKQ